MIKNNLVVFGIFFLFLFISIFYYVAFAIAADEDIMVVEVNVLNATAAGGDIVSIEVPDYLFFGNVTAGEKSEEFRVYVNNTGTVDIIVTPELTNSSEEIFDNLYLRKTKTKTVNGTVTDVPFTRIGKFSFNITKPASGKEYNDEYFYVILNLSSYAGEINQDIIGHKADVKFVAVAK